MPLENPGFPTDLFVQRLSFLRSRTCRIIGLSVCLYFFTEELETSNISLYTRRWHPLTIGKVSLRLVNMSRVPVIVLLPDRIVVMKRKVSQKDIWYSNLSHCFFFVCHAVASRESVPGLVSKDPKKSVELFSISHSPGVLYAVGELFFPRMKWKWSNWSFTVTWLIPLG
jgi:hypothetical protein